MEYRLTEIQRHFGALQDLGGAEELKKGIEASLKEHDGYKVTLAESTEKAEVYVKLLKRVLPDVTAIVRANCKRQKHGQKDTKRR